MEIFLYYMFYVIKIFFCKVMNAKQVGMNTEWLEHTRGSNKLTKTILQKHT